jgi:hypothetical protein
MDDAGGVRGVERIGQRDRRVDQRRRVERSALQPLLQRFPLQQLHDEEHAAVAGLADVEYRADVRVRQRRNRAGFPLQALPGLRRSGEMRGEHLDGDVPVKTRVARGVDLAHPAGTQDSENLVRTETNAGWEGHRLWVDG